MRLDSDSAEGEQWNVELGTVKKMPQTQQADEKAVDFDAPPNIPRVRPDPGMSNLVDWDQDLGNTNRPTEVRGLTHISPGKDPSQPIILSGDEDSDQSPWLPISASESSIGPCPETPLDDLGAPVAGLELQSPLMLTPSSCGITSALSCPMNQQTVGSFLTQPLSGLPTMLATPQIASVIPSNNVIYIQEDPSMHLSSLGIRAPLFVPATTIMTESAPNPAAESTDNAFSLIPARQLGLGNSITNTMIRLSSNLPETKLTSLTAPHVCIGNTGWPSPMHTNDENCVRILQPFTPGPIPLTVSRMTRTNIPVQVNPLVSNTHDQFPISPVPHVKTLRSVIAPLMIDNREVKHTLCPHVPAVFTCVKPVSPTISGHLRPETVAISDLISMGASGPQLQFKALEGLDDNSTLIMPVVSDSKTDIAGGAVS